MNHCPSPRLNVQVRHPDPIVRAGLLAALHAHASQDISVYEVNDGLPYGEPPIDVVVTDYDNAMQLSNPSTRKAQRRLADARILAVTANDREADIKRALQAGIHGYLLLGGTLDEFVDVVRKVGRGARWLCPEVAERIAESLAGDALTAREHQVLQLVITGESNKVIARQLTIELGTVKSHMRAIMTKLGATSRTQAAGIAVSRGLVDKLKPPRAATFAARHRAIEASRRFA